MKHDQPAVQSTVVVGRKFKACARRRHGTACSIPFWFYKTSVPTYLLAGHGIPWYFTPSLGKNIVNWIVLCKTMMNQNGFNKWGWWSFFIWTGNSDWNINSCEDIFLPFFTPVLHSIGSMRFPQKRTKIVACCRNFLGGHVYLKSCCHFMGRFRHQRANMELLMEVMIRENDVNYWNVVPKATILYVLVIDLVFFWNNVQ